MKQKKELLNRAFMLLEGISWKTQTTVARDKWKEARQILLKLSKLLKCQVKMRSKEEIEKDMECYDNNDRDNMVLELLLDIRELLNDQKGKKEKLTDNSH